MEEETKKIWGSIFIVFVAIGIMIFCWYLALNFSQYHSKEYVSLVLQCSIFITGFGLLYVAKKENLNEEYNLFRSNSKSITTWALLSIFFSFIYLSSANSPFLQMFFNLSSALLFFSLGFILILVIFSRNKYLLEIES